MGRRRDAALTLAVLAAVAVAAVAVEAPVTGGAVSAGATGALALEALLSLRAGRARAAWERPRVQIGAIAVLAGGAAVALEAVGPVALTVLAAGLGTYLALLALAAVGSE